MTTLELLKELYSRDIHLRRVGNELKACAPERALTPELHAALVAHKPVLVALFLAQERMLALEVDQVQLEYTQEALAEDEISLQCCVCGAEVEYYSEEGVAYCEAHWVG